MDQMIVLAIIVSFFLALLVVYFFPKGRMPKKPLDAILAGMLIDLVWWVLLFVTINASNVMKLKGKSDTLEVMMSPWWFAAFGTVILLSYIKYRLARSRGLL